MVRRLKPAPGTCTAPEAGLAAGQWAVFGSASFLAILPWDRLGASGWAALARVALAFACLLVGTTVWLLKPDDLLVPKALRGAPGYLQERGLL